MQRNQANLLLLVAGVAVASLTGGCSLTQVVADTFGGDNPLAPAAWVFPAMAVPVLAGTGNEKEAIMVGVAAVMINLAAIHAERASQDEKAEGRKNAGDAIEKARQSHPDLDQDKTLVAYPVGPDEKGRQKYVLIDPVTKEVKNDVIIVPEKEQEAIGSNGAVDIQDEAIPVIGGKKIVFVEPKA